MDLDRLSELYEEHIVDPGNELHLLILASFLLTFVITRLVTHSIRNGGPLPFVRNISRGNTHIHHLVPGILLLLLVGYVLAGTDPTQRAPWAVLYGIGAALTLDEFALWLSLKDVYWEREGRRSIDAVIIFGSIAAMGVFGAGFVISVAREIFVG